MQVLISLHRGYGLGDAVQMSAVLRHVVAARPDWVINYQAEEGKHQVAEGLVHSHFSYGTPNTTHYDCEVQICLYDTWAGWHDRPNTRVSSALHEVFGLEWKPEYARYKVNLTKEVIDQAQIVLNVFEPWPRKHSHLVAFHYKGDSSQGRKNLTDIQAREICEYIKQCVYKPLLLDWRSQSDLRHDYPSLCYRLGCRWGKSADYNCAVISQCAAFIGIDSGPSKCAAATDTPSLVIWTGHHPANFFDPAPNVTHLIPKGYAGLYPVVTDTKVLDWFERHYNIRFYEGDPVTEVKKWLENTLKF